ncbi:MAG TPA: hypothetical protein VHX87_02360 [Galbitalea sp.]|nr:hypothetical protein [Galbitalea sp.]
MMFAVLALLLPSAAMGQTAAASVPSLSIVYQPHIVGLPVVGNELRVTAGTWKGASPLFYSFAWRSPTKSLLSSSTTYTPTASDLGQVLTVRVSVQDGDNNSDFVDVSTAPITASDVVNTTAPKFTGGLVVGKTVSVSHGKFTSGSGALSYTYQWSTSDGQSTTPLTDTGTTHRITNADLGRYLSVVVTATSPTQKGTVTARTDGAVIPAVPFASEAALTSSNQGLLTGKTSKNVATITVPDGTKNDGVFVYGYSKPTILGWFALNDRKRFTVDYAVLPAGEHKLVVIDQSGKKLGWVAVDRPADAPPLFAASNAPIGIAAAAFVVIVIVLLVLLSRSRARKRRRH